jgi:hypothetical protein
MLLLLGVLFDCFRFAFLAYFKTRAMIFSSGVVLIFATAAPYEVPLRRPNLIKTSIKQPKIGTLRG